MKRTDGKTDMKMKELCPDERPREKMISKGADSLSNAELLAILLRTGTGRHNVLETAQMLLKMADGSLSGLVSMSVERMCSIGGIGQGKAVTVAAALELGKRYGREMCRLDKVSITGPEMIYRMMLPEMRGLKHEECWVLYLNRANYVIGKERFSKGGLDSTTVDVRMIVKTAIEKLASGVILVHNHPSGNPMPGQTDIKLTGRLKAAMETFDISLVDHVVMCDDRFYSFSDERMTIKTDSGSRPE